METQQFFSLTLEVTNSNDASLSYTGYVKDSFAPPLKEGQIVPLSQIDLKRDGKWQPDPKGYCGTGLADLELTAKSSATFAVLVPGGGWQAVKVGIGHFPGWSNEEASTTTIWSTEFTREAVAAAVERPMSHGTRDAGLPVGKWSVEFSNGVAETCEIRSDGTAYVVEPLRTAGGKARVEESSVVITFDDDRVERWTAVGKRHVVEHWFPTSHFTTASPVFGISERRE